ncbi:MAG: hypothetical protein A3H72_02705 [Candidatus Doudnabacteria bacterium RIFCSPLOWO2_02_FULL_48_8]|uniref:Uncharacterized protein n=1 Tax=Candidatus Doudnabacteria bacterium RIFCSPHIGHO2_01_FULL_46_24 TaxID=1817825 RepID=A0A1F5NUZ0_9BACT|nr:MAG: hypothetical protein A2720_03070 [Candidatus Doudnabacteria bacterium RIFCSPHIGHO2_01_FULL_46_24]OGE95087.1 MAG: hypothetical protein A3H72_02705 [Candidatus Doudnabacteria bacterium RIFCSPLOWO2_02_FULL_48_8]OGE95763.1 MAG: hypothetical protein A3E98_02840 [Candidatus Doudnabacteria bacterium RIFCSPHIGHO2_12_FULL_48_11]
MGPRAERLLGRDRLSEKDDLSGFDPWSLTTQPPIRLNQAVLGTASQGQLDTEPGNEPGEPQEPGYGHGV